MLLVSYAQEVEPTHWLGVALLFVAVVFFAVDLVVTNHGLPTLAALAALILGILTLFEPASLYLQASLVVLVVGGILAAVLFVTGSREVLAARGRQVTTGTEGMIGEVGVVREPVGASSPGWVFVHGEWWRAVPAIAPEDAYEGEDHKQVIGVGRKVQVVGFRDGNVVVLPLGSAAIEY